MHARICVRCQELLPAATVAPSEHAKADRHSGVVNTVISTIAAVAILVSGLVVCKHVAAIPYSDATALAHTKICVAYTWGKTGWGCSPLDSVSQNPLPTLLSILVATLGLLWFRKRLDLSLRGIALIIYSVVAFAVFVGRFVGFVFTELATSSYFFWAIPWALPLVVVVTKWEWESRRDQFAERARRKKADAALDAEIRERLRESRKT